MCSTKHRTLSRVTWYFCVAVTLATAVAGFTLFVYGLQIIPFKLSPEQEAAISLEIYTDHSAYSRTLQQIQLKSEGFKLTMTGLGVIGGGILFMGLVACRYEIEPSGGRVVPQQPGQNV